MANAIEKSKYCAEIEQRIVDGESDRAISNWLEEEKGIKISYATIYNHRRDNLNITRESVKEYERKRRKELMQPYINKRVSDIEYCDHLIQIAAALELKVDVDQKITALDIHKLALQAVSKKADLLKDSPSKTVNHNIIIPEDTETRAKGRQLIEFIRNKPEGEE